MVSFYNYPKQQWQHLRTTNPVESPFAGLRLRTDAAKRFKKVNNAQAVIWKMLLVAEKRFRRAPELMRDVYQGAKYVNGVLVNQESRLSLFTHLLMVAPAGTAGGPTTAVTKASHGTPYSIKSTRIPSRPCVPRGGGPGWPRSSSPSTPI